MAQRSVSKQYRLLRSAWVISLWLSTESDLLLQVQQWPVSIEHLGSRWHLCMHSSGASDKQLLSFLYLSHGYWQRCENVCSVQSVLSIVINFNTSLVLFRVTVLLSPMSLLCRQDKRGSSDFIETLTTGWTGFGKIFKFRSSVLDNAQLTTWYSHSNYLLECMF